MKKFISFVLAIFFLFTLNINIFAIPPRTEPNTSDPMTIALKKTVLAWFKAHNAAKNQGIKWQNRDKDKEISSEAPDFRRIVVQNIPHMLQTSKPECFIREALSVYIKTKAIQETAYEKIRNKTDEMACISEYITEIIDGLAKKRQSDSNFRQNLHNLAVSMGVTEDEVFQSQIIVATSDGLARNFSPKNLNKAIVGGAFLAGGVICSGVVAALAIKSGITLVAAGITTATTSALVSTIVPGIGALLAIGFGIYGIVKCYKANQAYKQAYEEKVLIAKAKITDDLFQTQKVENLAKIITKFNRMLEDTESAARVAESNLFLWAYDPRNFGEKTNEWKINNKQLANDGGFCNFYNIENIDGSPIAKNYETPGKRSFKHFIDIYHAAREASEKSQAVDYYEQLLKYADGTAILPVKYSENPNVKIARNLLMLKKIPSNEIAIATGLSLEDITELEEDIQKRK